MTHIHTTVKQEMCSTKNEQRLYACNYGTKINYGQWRCDQNVDGTFFVEKLDAIMCNERQCFFLIFGR